MAEQTAAVASKEDTVFPDSGDLLSDNNTSTTSSGGSSKKNTESKNPLSKIAKTTASYGNNFRKTGTSKMQHMRESGGGAVDSLSRNTGKIFKNVTSPIKNATTAVTGGVKNRIPKSKRNTSSVASGNSTSTANKINEKPSTVSRRSTTEDLEDVTLKSSSSMESNGYSNDKQGSAEDKQPLPLEDEAINMKEKRPDSDAEKKTANAPILLPIGSGTFTKKIKSAAKGTGKMVKTATAPVKGGIKKIGKSIPVVQEKAKRTAKTVVDKGIKAPVTAVTAPIVKHISRSSGDSTVSTKDEDENEDDNIDIRENDDCDVTKVLPDAALKKMKVIIKKRLIGISIQDFYNICWSEGCLTDAPPLYHPWLVASGKEDIEVQDWVFAKEDDEFVGSWDGEKYPQKRMVTFKFHRTGPLLGGPPVANVEHTQYCRVEGNDKCVLATTVRMQGIPFADTFTVEIRWVARRLGLANIQIEIGLFVNFSKTSFVAGQIRGGTTTETTKTQLDLFGHVKGACSKFSGEELDEDNAFVADSYDDDDDTNGPETCLICFGSFFSKLFKAKKLHLDEYSIP